MLTGQLSIGLPIYIFHMIADVGLFHLISQMPLGFSHIAPTSRPKQSPRKISKWAKAEIKNLTTSPTTVVADPAHLFSARTHWAVITPITVWSLLSSQPPLVVWSLAAPVRRPLGVNCDASVREILNFQWWHFVLICKIGHLCFNILKEETSQKAQLTQTLHWML